MAKLNMTRRAFTQLAAATAAAVGVIATSESQALAKLPAVSGKKDGDVSIVRSCCRACGKNECGVYVTVRNGRATKTEGDADTAFHSMGNCCTKSQASLQTAYHPNHL